MFDLRGVAELLRRYADRYEFLDAFADDVDELRERVPAGLVVTEASNGEVLVQADNTRLLMTLFPEQGIARFRMPEKVGPPGTGEKVGVGTGWDDLIGTAVRSATKKKDGLLDEVIVGMLVGGSVGGATQPIERVLALRFEPMTGDWQRFDGPLLRWAKQTLRPALPPAA